MRSGRGSEKAVDFERNFREGTLRGPSLECSGFPVKKYAIEWRVPPRKVFRS
jgi:hypothetical protein